MIPLRLVAYDWRRHLLGSSLVVILITATLCLSIVMTLQERGLRLGTARASEQFDILIGGAGSETQLVLSTIFLQPSPLPLLSQEDAKLVQADPLVAWSAPLTFGDFYQNFPIVGTTTQFLTQNQTRKLAAGNVFNAIHEAVVGSETGLALGQSFTPLHGQFQTENSHLHDEVHYTVVGILPPTHSVWDRAILVPINSVWQIHNHSHEDHEDADHEEIDHETDDSTHAIQETHTEALNQVGLNESINGAVSAMVIKPVSIASAYKIREKYKAKQLLALFPAEVLVKLYSLLGDMSQLMRWLNLGTQLLVSITIMIIVAMQVRQRTQELATLRALGAPKMTLCFLVWLGVIGLVVVGTVMGSLSGWWLSKLIAHYINGKTGFVMIIEWQQTDLMMLLSILGLSGVVAVIPAILAYRQSPEKLLKQVH